MLVLPNKHRPMRARMIWHKMASANDTPAVHCSAVCSCFTTLLSLAAAASITVSLLAAPPAEARCWGCAVGVGVAAGVVTGAIVGSAIANADLNCSESRG